jgi:NAD(P)-dependent dehydrogenase (short-subunit alcohol dehydrogenase family)
MAIAIHLLNTGHRVALLDWDAPELNRTATTLAALGEVLPLVADVGQPSDVELAVNRIAQTWGRLDALVNNAGVAIFKPIGETTFDDWQAVMATNLNGPFICTQACVPLLMASSGGAVVNIASISGLRASTLRVAYGTSKAALIHLTKQQAVELGNAGIRVNAIAPGPVDTAMAKLVHTAAIRADYHDAIPLERYGTPEEIAAAVGFLCSPAASYINGQVLAVDGGFDAAGVGLPTLRSSQPSSARCRSDSSAG